MPNDLTIDDDTNGLKMTFVVTNSMDVNTDYSYGNSYVGDGLIEFTPLGFNVTFETF